MLTISVIYSFYNTAQFHRKETITKVVNRVNILNLTNLQHLIHDAHICMTAMPKVLIIMMSECFENGEHVQARLRPCSLEAANMTVQFRAHFFNILRIFDSYFTLYLIDQRLRPIWSEERWNKTTSSFLGDSSVYARASWEVRCSLEAWRRGDHHD